MKNSSGLWIDHREAVIVTLGTGREAVCRVTSHVEKHPHLSASATPGPFEAQKVKADDRRLRALTGHRRVYYDEVIASLPALEGLLVFGPGEAKNELVARLGERRPGLPVTVETSDAMTDAQTVAKVQAWVN